MPIPNPVLCQLSDTQDRRNTAEAAPKSANGTRPVAYTACRKEFTFRLERSHNVSTGSRSAACLCQFRQPLLADYLDEAMKVFDALDNPTPWHFAERAEIAVAHPDIERPRCGRRCIGVSELDRPWEEE